MRTWLLARTIQSHGSEASAIENLKRFRGLYRAALCSGFEGCLALRLEPFAMLADQILQTLHRFHFGNVEFHRRFADVKIHLARSAAHITKIGIGHFARPVYD